MNGSNCIIKIFHFNRIFQNYHIQLISSNLLELHIKFQYNWNLKK